VGDTSQGTARRRRPCSWAVRVFSVVNFGYMRPPLAGPMFPLCAGESREGRFGERL
jgi:hypothetical protein